MTENSVNTHPIKVRIFQVATTKYSKKLGKFCASQPGEEATNVKSSFILYGLAAIGVLALIGEIAYPFDQEQDVAVHNMFCSTIPVEGVCKTKGWTQSRDFYRASPANQTVLYWTDDKLIIHRYTFCAVIDGENWSCKDEKAEEFPKIEFRMVGGEYSENRFAEPTDPLEKALIRNNHIYTTSRWRWWRAWVTEVLASKEH